MHKLIKESFVKGLFQNNKIYENLKKIKKLMMVSVDNNLQTKNISTNKSLNRFKSIDIEKNSD